METLGDLQALQMGVNIYLYAMIQTGGVPPKQDPEVSTSGDNSP